LSEKKKRGKLGESAETVSWPGGEREGKRKKNFVRIKGRV